MISDGDKAALRLMKDQVSAELAKIGLDGYNLGAVDSRLHDYCSEVINNPRGHNLYELLALRRFLSMVSKYGLNARRVKAFFAFYECLKFPGVQGNRCYELTPVQCFQFANIFGFWRGGKRVVREAVLYVPRKFSKTTSTAALAVWDLLFGDANAESYTGANSADQAKKCFDVVRGCVRALDPEGRRFVVNEQIIKTISTQRTAKAQCLTANARTKDGLNASTVIMDEYSQARDSNLLTVLTTSMGVRKNPLTVIITTASEVYNGPFFDMLQGYKRLLRGEVEDDTVFAHLFEPDIDDAEDDPQTWHKVHPHMGVTVSEEFYEREYQKAQRNGADALLAFRTKLLNVYSTNERRAWIQRDILERRSRPMSHATMRGDLSAFIAIDLSKCDDFTAVTTAYFDNNYGGVSMITDYFFPEGALPGHQNEQLYRKWGEEGWLHLLPGEVIDYALIRDHIMGVAELAQVVNIGYDAAKSIELANYLRSEGLGELLFAIPQGLGYFTSPVNALERALKTGGLTIDANPINLFCFANSVLDTDTQGNMKPMKRAENLKIDGVITMLMAMRQLLLWRK